MRGRGALNQTAGAAVGLTSVGQPPVWACAGGRGSRRRPSFVPPGFFSPSVPERACLPWPLTCVGRRAARRARAWTRTSPPHLGGGGGRRPPPGLWRVGVTRRSPIGWEAAREGTLGGCGGLGVSCCYGRFGLDGVGLHPGWRPRAPRVSGGGQWAPPTTRGVPWQEVACSTAWSPRAWAGGCGTPRGHAVARLVCCGVAWRGSAVCDRGLFECGPRGWDTAPTVQ